MTLKEALLLLFNGTKASALDGTQSFGEKLQVETPIVVSGSRAVIRFVDSLFKLHVDAVAYHFATSLAGRQLQWACHAHSITKRRHASQQ